MFAVSTSKVRRLAALAGIGILGSSIALSTPDAQAQTIEEPQAVQSRAVRQTSTDTQTITVGDGLAPIAPTHLGENFTAELVPTSEMPAGVGFVTSTKEFTGTTSTPGVDGVQILFTDSDTQQQELQTITVVVRPLEPTTVLGEIGVQPDSLVTKNGTTLMVAELIAGQPPTGVGFRGDGFFSGKAEAVGIYEVDILITDLITDEQELRSVRFVIGEAELESDQSSDPEASSDDATEVLGIAQTPELAFTGSETWVFSIAGLGMVMAGAATLVAGRRHEELKSFDHIS